jgi:hypothetical protein
MHNSQQPEGYLQVMTRSNIANLAGDMIRSDISDQNKVREWRTNSKLKWPHQQRPPMNAFGIWKRFIQKILDVIIWGI